MAINLAIKFQPLVDEKFASESRISLITNNDYDFIGTHSIKIYSVGTAEMHDYARNPEDGGLGRYGTIKDLSTEVQEVSMEKDRSFTFSVDKADNDETLNALNVGTALARQIREVVIPEVDAYVYGKVVSGAGTTKTEELDAETAYDALATGNEALDEESVNVEGRVVVATPEFYKNLKADPKAILETEIGQEMRIKGVVGVMDGALIQKVPAKLLPTGVNFILAHPVATTFALKLADYKIHDDVVGISGSVAEGRIYYTAFVRNNKVKAIYVSKKPASI